MLGPQEAKATHTATWLAMHLLTVGVPPLCSGSHVVTAATTSVHVGPRCGAREPSRPVPPSFWSTHPTALWGAGPAVGNYKELCDAQWRVLSAVAKGRLPAPGEDLR